MIHRLLPVLGVLVAGAAVDAISAQPTAPRMMAVTDVLRGTEQEELRWPTAVAAASDAEVAVADAYGPRLLVFRRVGVSWTLAMTRDLTSTPVGLAWAARRYVISPRGLGSLLEMVGEDLTPRPMPLPARVVPGPLAAIGDGDLLLYDAAASRVLRLDGGGQVEVLTTVDGVVTGLAAAGDNFLVALGDQSRIQRFSATGQLLDTWNLPSDGPVPAWPVGLDSDPGGRVFVADRHGGRILVLDGQGQWIGLGGREGWDPGLLLRPAGLARLPGGLLLVADQGNGRAQLFQLGSEVPGS